MYLSAGTCVQVQAQVESGVNYFLRPTGFLVAPSNLTVSLQGDLSFFSDSGCSHSISNLTVAKGATVQNFYVQVPSTFASGEACLVYDSSFDCQLLAVILYDNN